VKETMGRAGYSIAVVSKLTGVSCHTLRVWERRYGFPVPRRSPSGHRRYGADQVERLRQIAQQIQEGRMIGDLMASRRGAVTGSAPEPDPLPMANMEASWELLVASLGTGAIAEAEQFYGRLVEGLAPRERIERVIEPALIETGERWFRGQLDIGQEHLATEFLRRKLSAMIAEAQQANAQSARTVLVGAVQGERHIGGVLIVTLLLELAGWRTLCLGTDLPTREFQKAIERWHPDAVGISFVLSRNITKRFTELSQLTGAPVFVGGRSILNYRSLARRHGLIPLPGPGGLAVERLIAEVSSQPVLVPSSAPVLN